MSIDQKANLTPEAETVRELYAALNRNDIPAIMKLFAPDIVRVEPEGFPASGTYRGHAEIEAHFSQARDTWAEGACEPEQIMVSGDKVVALVHVRVRLKNKTEWIDGRVGDGFAFRKGKIVEMRTFLKDQQALDWAGIR